MKRSKFLNNNIRAAQIVLPEEQISQFQNLIVIPNYITVHLGSPDEDAENVTIPFIDYIKNVGSSELYPTWPEEALRANIHAIVSIALNRIFTEWYRSRGYNFDITNSTQYDQAFVPNRGIFDSIGDITNEIFNQYIVREGRIEPFFAQFCDGRVSQCDGLLQWGTVDLANEGYSPIEILRYYYGDDVNIITDVPFGDIEESYPGEPLEFGDSGLNVFRFQHSLNRISRNYPAIQEIYPLDGFFGEQTLAAVEEFQRIFNLPVTGVVDLATWNQIRRIYVAVTKLAELASEGLTLAEISEPIESSLLEGSTQPAVGLIQYFLTVLSIYYPTIPEVQITNFFDEQTKLAVIEFQKTVGLPETGIVNLETLQALYDSVTGIFESLPSEAVYIPFLQYPGIEYSIDYASQNPGVIIVQEMLAYISLIIPTIPPVETNGTYDEATRQAVIAFQNMEGLEPTGTINEATWNRLVEIYRRQRFGGTIPGTDINRFSETT